MIGGRVLDVSAILDLAKGTSVYGQALLITATEHGIALAAPSVALQAAWQAATTEGRPWLELLPSLPTVVVLSLAEADARAAGLLAAGQPDALLATSHAVHIAQTRQWPVVTSDPGGVLRLDPSISTEALP